MQTKNNTFTVSEFIEVLNVCLHSLDVEVVGEISEIKVSVKGHTYFTLKDSTTGDTLPCTIWKNDRYMSSVEPEMGMEVLVKGTPDFYGPFGKMSFHARSMELVGEGQLKRAYDILKKKLSAEGLFEEGRKRSLPEFPKVIGVITSMRGEVIHDFSNNLRKSGFKVKILHSPVEGPESGKHLALSVRFFREKEIDALVIIRGGGSMQSLAGFDNEALVREIASFPKPVVVGIGHHQDIPLAALVADISESTPSMAASVISRSWDEASLRLTQLEAGIFDSYRNRLESVSGIVSESVNLAEELMHSVFKRYEEVEYKVLLSTKALGVRIYENRSLLNDRVLSIQRIMIRDINSVKNQVLVGLTKRSMDRFSYLIEITSERLFDTCRFVQANDPRRQMALGYSIVLKDGRVVKSKRGLKVGQDIDIKLFDGDMVSEIKRL